MHPVTGVVRTARPLDAETLRRAALAVTAHDTPPDPALRRTATAALVVNVEDYNDNTPFFDLKVSHESLL